MTQQPTLQRATQIQALSNDVSFQNVLLEIEYTREYDSYNTVPKCEDAFSQAIIDSDWKL